MFCIIIIIIIINTNIIIVINMVSIITSILVLLLLLLLGLTELCIKLMTSLYLATQLKYGEHANEMEIGLVCNLADGKCSKMEKLYNQFSNK